VLLHEADAGVDEERHAPEHAREGVGGHALAHAVQHRLRRRQRIGDLLNGRGAGLLQVVRADVDRVPLRNLVDGEGDHVRDQPHRGLRRERVGAARQELLDDVVLGRALKGARLDAVLLRHRHVQGQQPGGRGVDRHRRVHLVERDAVEQGVHVALVGDRDPDLADLAAGELVIGVVASLGGEIEGHREAGLALCEIAPVELIRLPRRRMAGIGAHHPGGVALGEAMLGHAENCMVGSLCPVP
jgi:hypothetical protein